MKRKTTKEILAESFRELAANRPIDKITIREITDNCGYSPATFYRQFRDKYDLIAWDYAKGVEEIMDRIDNHAYVWRQTLTDGARYMLGRRDYLMNLLLHTSGHDAFIRYITDINQEAFTQHILKATGQKSLDEMTEMYVRMFCIGTASLTCECIEGRYRATPEQLGRIFEESLPDPLREYLL